MRGNALLTALAALAIVGLAIAGAGGAAGSSPDGMVGVPSDNVGPPDHANAPDDAGPPSFAGPPEHAEIPTHAAAWDLQSSDHAGDLVAQIGVVGADPGGGPNADDGQLAIVLSDDVNHDGRTVSLRADTLVDALDGDRPEAVHGTHSSGMEWTASVEYSGGYAIFDVPKFSSNTVTFEGRVELAGDPATDGATFSYGLEQPDDVESIDVELTGAPQTATSTEHRSDLRDGDATTLDVGGTTTADVDVEFTGAESLGPDWSKAQASANGIGTDGELRVVSDGSEIAAYEPDGTVRWSTTAYSATGVGITEGGRIFTSQSDSNVYELDPTDGSELASGDVWGEEEVSAGSGIVVVGGGVALDVTDPDSLSGQTDLPSNSGIEDHGASGPYGAVALDTWGSSGFNGVILLDSSGNTYFEQSGGTTPQAVDVADVGGDAIVAVGDGSDVTARDAAGNLLWSTDLGSSVGDVATDGDAVVAADGTDLVELDPADGSVVERHATAHTSAITRVDIRGTEWISWSSAGETLATIRDLDAESPALSGGGETWEHEGTLATGETATDGGTLDPDTHDLTAALDGGAVGVSFSVEETTETVDPAVVVNGDVTGLSGTLADGETATVDVDPASLADDNTVEVVVSDAYDGPDGAVGLSYSHAARDDHSVEYAAEAWSERYDVSKTFASDQADVELTIPFDSSRVVGIRDLQIRWDGGDWVDVHSSNYDLDGAELYVSIGDVVENETVEVRATGSKVDVEGGEIEVVDPTVEGDVLDTQVELVEVGDGFGIDVSGTAGGDWIHYADDASWQDAQPYVEVDADGGAVIRTPGASNGATATIKTSDLQVEPDSGSADVRIDDVEEPIFSVDRLDGDRATVRWADTVSGETYVLRSTTRDVEVDRATASSPVDFLIGSADTYRIVLGGGGSGGGGGGGAVAAGSSPLSLSVVFGGMLVTILATIVAARRLGLRGRGATATVALVGGGTALVGVEAVTSGSVLAQIAFELGQLSELVAVLGGTLSLAALLWVDRSTRFDVPRWLFVIAAGGTILWIAETVAPGSLSDGLAEVSAAIWVVALLGGIALAWRAMRPRPILVRGDDGGEQR